MEFSEFTQQIQNLLRERNGTVDVVIQTCTKNNGVEYTGVTIRETNSNIAPVIYLEPYYSRYLDNGKPILEIVSDIERVFVENKRGSLDVTWISDYEKVKERIIAVVVNKTRNEELLSKIPNREYIEDISVIYKILMDNFDNETATILVNNNLMNIWNVSEQVLFEQANLNNKLLCKPLKQGMIEVLAGLTEGTANAEITELLRYMEEDIYVLSTNSKVHGASCVLDNEFMKMVFGEVGGGFIIPCSVQEWIYIPASRDSDISENINSLIEEVNYTQLISEEVLGDKAYYYNGYSYEMIK